MTTLADQWRRQVPRDQANLTILADSLDAREALARDWVRQTQLRDLPVGIASCIARGTDSLGIPLPTDLVACEAIQAFRTSLHTQGFITDIAIEADTALFIVTPALG